MSISNGWKIEKCYVNNIFITHLQQILGGKLLHTVIGGKKVILEVGSN